MQTKKKSDYCYIWPTIWQVLKDVVYYRTLEPIKFMPWFFTLCFLGFCYQMSMNIKTYTGGKVIFIERTLKLKKGGKPWTQHSPKCTWWKYNPAKYSVKKKKESHGQINLENIECCMFLWGIHNTNGIVRVKEVLQLKKNVFHFVWPNVFKTFLNIEPFLYKVYEYSFWGKLT